MKRLIHILFILSLLLLFQSCADDDIEMAAYEPKVVVEGAIEYGESPVILLSVSASMTGPKDTLSLLNNVIRNAKVTVSDGKITEILTLQTNRDKLPPYEYRGSVLKGEVGKTYFLEIDYDKRKVTGETYIPMPVSLEKIWFKRETPQDTTGYIHIRFKNTSNEYYQVATRVFPGEKVTTPCLYGNVDSRLYSDNETISMQINKGPTILPETSYDTYYSISSFVLLKFSTISQDGYRFWTSYQNEVLNTQNPIFPANTSLISNIKGGIGVWCGYGTSVYRLNLQDIEE
ncbi:MAG: hypothetical protein E6767_04910 [Dysgonomonas sp.]|nr:hypothetical protein [Dysgonomonas sp.]